jgi:hypothetical protein
LPKLNPLMKASPRLHPGSRRNVSLGPIL